MKWEYYQSRQQTFKKRTFKREKDMANFLTQDSLFMHVEAICENCNWKLKYTAVMQGMRQIGFELISWNQDILPEIISTIGGPYTEKPYNLNTIDQIEQLLISEKELRILVNRLYECIQIQKKEKMFDLVIFRELKGQLFWNWIFYFMHYSLPFDCLLPYNPYHLPPSSLSPPVIKPQYPCTSTSPPQ